MSGRGPLLSAALPVAVLAGLFILFAAATFTSKMTLYSIPALIIAGTICVLMIGDQFLRVTIRVDVAARRINVEEDFLGLRRETIVDCSFDQCGALGRREAQDPEGGSYNVHLLLKGRQKTPPHLNSHTRDRHSPTRRRCLKA